jgi:hypothetical protein
MQVRAHTNEDRLVTEFIAHVNGAGNGPEARDAYREGFTRLRSQLQMYPASARHASVGTGHVERLFVPSSRNAWTALFRLVSGTSAVRSPSSPTIIANARASSIESSATLRS